MAKTLKPSSADDDLFNQVRSLSEKLWLAGVGAVVTVQRKGGEWLTSLIEEGKKVESRLAASVPASRLTPPKKSLSPEQVEQLEALFQERVARALARLQVPTHQELQLLHRRMDQLSQSIRLLRQQLGD